MGRLSIEDVARAWGNGVRTLVFGVLFLGLFAPFAAIPVVGIALLANWVLPGSGYAALVSLFWLAVLFWVPISFGLPQEPEFS